MHTLLATPVTTTPQPSIDLESHIMLLGSCFTDTIGSRMEQGGLNILRNPFGVLYNPFSVATCLDYCLDNRPIGEEMLVQHDGLWHSWLHHTSLSHPNSVECLRQCNQRINAAHHYLQECDIIVITWGTAYTYFLVTQPSDNSTLPTPLLVANCHKVKAQHFERRCLSTTEIVERWQPLLQRLTLLPHKPHIIFTVSPIRHLSDGAHGNQISKATLHLALENLLSSNYSYFPAYEIMMDELRDYRFYNRDMLHPSDLAVDIIWKRFQQTYLLSETIVHSKEKEKQHRQELHRPINKYQ